MVCSDRYQFPDINKPTTYNYSSNQSAITDTIIITNTTGLMPYTTYYCAVVAMTDATMYRIYSTLGARVLLSYNQNWWVETNGDVLTYMDFYMRGGNDTLVIFNGEYSTPTVMYIVSTTTILPSPSNYLVSVSTQSNPSNPASIIVPKSACPTPATTCRMSLGVTASTMNQHQHGYITVSIITAMRELTAFEFQSVSNAAMNTIRRYYFDVASTTANITVVLTSRSGNANIYMSRNADITPNNAVWSSTLSEARQDKLKCSTDRSSIKRRIDHRQILCCRLLKDFRQLLNYAQYNYFEHTSQ